MRKFISIVTVVVVLLGAYFGLMFGCVAKTNSILTEGRRVTRAELAVELSEVQADHERTIARAKLADADLTRQEARNAEIKAAIAEIASGGVNMALSGSATAGGAIGLGLLGAVAAGLGVALRKAKQQKTVGGVVVQALDVLRRNPQTQLAFEAALKNVLAKASLSKADYDRAIVQLKASAEPLKETPASVPKTLQT